MKVAAWYSRHLPLFEFALRIYIAYYLADYGYAKLTGGMFNNASPEILKTELQKVDQFHLTWYFFHQMRLLTYMVGICQLLSAALLLFNKTVLLGCAFALPIFVNIFLIDITVFPDNVLAIRVFVYLLCISLFVLYRRKSLIMGFNQLTQNSRVLNVKSPLYYLAIPFLLFLYLAFEIVITRLGSKVF